MKHKEEEWEKEIIWDTKGSLCGVTKDDEVGIVLKIDYWGARLIISGKYFPMGLTIKIPDDSFLKLAELLERNKRFFKYFKKGGRVKIRNGIQVL